MDAEIIPPSHALTIIENGSSAVSTLIAGTAFEQAEAMTPWQRLEMWLNSLGTNTRRGYEADLERFARDTGCDSVQHALEALCTVKRSAALAVVENWRNTMVEFGTSSATINRRLSAVNSALRELGKADFGPGRLQISLVKAEPRRETAGPGLINVVRAAELLVANTDPSAVRDLAILLLGAQRGLRRAEIASLRMEDVDLSTCTLRVLRKGKRERIAVDIAGETCATLARWLAVRPQFVLDGVDAVFVGLMGKHRGKGMTGQGVWFVIKRIGSDLGQAGAKWRPHGLRHTAISEALRVSNGSLPSAMEFAGHAGPQVTSRYLDNKRELAQQVVTALSGQYLPEAAE